jgi:DNA topoisomerase-2
MKGKAPVSKAKPKTASKKKVLVDHNENAEDSLMDDIGEGDASGNDQFDASSSNLQAVASSKKKKTVSETYTKVVHSPINFV